MNVGSCKILLLLTKYNSVSLILIRTNWALVDNYIFTGEIIYCCCIDSAVIYNSMPKSKFSSSRSGKIKSEVPIVQLSILKRGNE